MNKKDLILYVSIFLVSFIISNVMFYYILKSRLSPVPDEIDETTEITEIERIPIPEDLTDWDDDTLPDPVTEYQKAMFLRQKLIDLFSGDKYIDYSRTEIDSILVEMTTSIDELAGNVNKYVSRIQELERTINTLNNDIYELQQELRNREEKISSLISSHRAEVEGIREQRYSDSVRSLAETYNTMNANRVAQLLQSLDNKTIIDILNNMDQRRAGKVLEAFPPAKAGQITQEMLE